MIYLEIAILMIIGLGLSLAAIYYLINFLVRRGLRPRDVVISKGILIGNSWTEMPSEKPAKPRGHTQNIYLKVSGYEFDWQRESFDIRLTNGTIVHPTIQVIDGSGKSYDAKDGTRWGNLVGFSIKPAQNDDRITDNRQNVLVRIRSSEPFECAEIGWRTKRMK